MSADKIPGVASSSEKVSTQKMPLRDRVEVTAWDSATWSPVSVENDINIAHCH